MKEGKLVPFGKYKGKPVEELAADTDYLEWLRTQPWFVDKFSWLDRAIVVVNPGVGIQQPVETPEHNALQIRFLEAAFVRGFITLASPRIERSVMLARDKVVSSLKERLRSIRDSSGYYEFREHSLEDLQRGLAEAEEAKSRPGVFLNTERIERVTIEIARRVKQLERLELAERLIDSVERLEIADFEFSLTDLEFEFQGIDVTLGCEFWWTTGELFPSYYDSPKGDVIHVCYAKRNDFTIEVKPHVGDDYPAVLRQMNANKSKYLVLGSFESRAIDVMQLRAFFDASGKKVITVAEIEAAASSLPEWLRLESEEER